MSSSNTSGNPTASSSAASTGLTTPRKVKWEECRTISTVAANYILDPRKYSNAPGFAAIDLASELGPKDMDAKVVEYIASRIFDVFTDCQVWDEKYTRVPSGGAKPSYWVPETVWFTRHDVFDPPEWWESAVSDHTIMERLIRQLGPPPLHTVPMQ